MTPSPNHIPSPYLNNYTPPPPQSFPDPEDCHPNTPYQLYDLNFAGGPIPSPEALRTDKVALLPFIPSLYAGKFYEELQKGDCRGVMRLMPYPRDMAASLEELLQGVEVSMRGVEDNLLFAIFDLSRLASAPTSPRGNDPYEDYWKEDQDGTASPTLPLPPDHPPLECMAGIIAIFCDRKNLTGELGHIIILPKAQRTHVLSHAAGLLMHYALDFPYISTYDPALKRFVEPPTSSTTPLSKALGLRRLQWQAHAINAASIRSAGRLGFQPEGIVRMHGTARGGDEEGRQGDGAPMSRSNWVGSIIWKDWEAGGAGVIDGLVAR